MEQRRRSAKITKRNRALPPIRRMKPIPAGVFESDTDTESDDDLPIILTGTKLKQKKAELEEGITRRRKRQQTKLLSLIPEISQDILDKFPSIPADTLLDIKRNLIVENFKGIPKKNLIKDLLSDDTAFKICSKEIGEGFIEETIRNEKMKGFVISFKGDMIAFVFYFEKQDELKIELICVKKQKGTLKGFPLGQITMHIVFNLAKSVKKIKVALESVRTPNTLSFYRMLGFKKFGKTLKSGLFLLKKRV